MGDEPGRAPHGADERRPKSPGDEAQLGVRLEAGFGEGHGEGLTPTLDLSGEAEPTEPRPSEPPVAPYDPEPQREQLRGWIAVTLVGLLVGTVLFAFLLLAFSSKPTDELKEVLALILSPIVSLVSAVIGFYYGSSRSRP